jgi:ABC-type sulfate transport system substrate-binding protein
MYYTIDGELAGMIKNGLQAPLVPVVVIAHGGNIIRLNSYAKLWRSNWKTALPSNSPVIN